MVGRGSSCIFLLLIIAGPLVEQARDVIFLRLLLLISIGALLLDAFSLGPLHGQLGLAFGFSSLLFGFLIGQGLLLSGDALALLFGEASSNCSFFGFPLCLLLFDLYLGLASLVSEDFSLKFLLLLLG